MTPDWNILHKRSLLARAAYPSNGTHQPWRAIERRVREELGYSRFAGFDAAGTQAFVCANESEVVFVYRGSDDLRDWVQNLKFLRRARVFDRHGRALGRVHRGFLAATCSIADRVADQVQRWRRDGPPRQVIGVGHSLGAACAALTALLSLPDCRPSLALFGCPRIGNRRFAREFDLLLGDRTLSIRNHNDIVTLSPFWNRPIGRQWYLHGDGSISYAPGWWYRCGQQIQANLKWAANVTLRWLSNGQFGRSPEWMEQVGDHLMDGYVEALRVAAGQQTAGENGAVPTQRDDGSTNLKRG